MSEKFPALDDAVSTDDGTSDFLSREKELLGDEFATDKDAELLKEAAGEEEDEEIKKFEDEFPDVTGANQRAEEEDDDDEFQEGQSNFQEQQFQSTFKSLSLNPDDSVALKEWKERRDLEISKRDEIAAEKSKELKAEAQQSIDDFYDNYNKKKDVGIEKTRKEAAEFVDKRDNFVSSGTVWSRVVDLLALKEEKRDTDRFRQLLLKLSKKEDAPGAAGY